MNILNSLTLFKDIALDDIRVLTSCPPSTDRFCDFESSDICRYEVLDGEMKWVRGSSASILDGEKPEFDQ